ncbi:hypothetical protein [Helicobacter pylori]|uniref:hypothetical protein n=1 Tax=Helicobacter pylori TaxID=210 RepID=UPI003593CFDE
MNALVRKLLALERGGFTGENSWYHTIYKSWKYGIVYRFWASVGSGVDIDMCFSLEGVEYEKEVPLFCSDDEDNWKTIRPCEPLNHSDLWDAVKKDVKPPLSKARSFLTKAFN